MRIVLEAEAARLVTMDEAIDAVESAFAAFHRGRVDTLPVVTASGFGDGEFWAIKGGVDRDRRLAGLKLGTYWPGNRDKGIVPHASTVLLLDPETGHLAAMVQASALTAIRTAAADAVAVRHLARRDASILAISVRGTRHGMIC